MSLIREMLANGEHTKKVLPEIQKVQERITTYWNEFEFDDNGFELKDTTKAHRMEKSDRARTHRKNIKNIKQRHLEENVDGKWYMKRTH